MSARSTPSSLVRRPSRAIPAGLLAVALVVAGGLGVWLLGTYLFDDAWPPAAADAVAAVANSTLDHPIMRVVAIVLAVAGIAMLLAAIIPGRPSRVRLLDDQIPGETAISHRDLARRVQRRAQNVDGVHSARVTVGRRRIDVLVRTVVDDTAPVATAARAAVEHTVRELQFAPSPRSRVRTRRRS